MTALSPRRTFSGTALKTIACITMLVDHIGASCIEAGILTPGLDAGTLSQDTLSAYPLDIRLSGLHETVQTPVDLLAY